MQRLSSEALVKAHRARVTAGETASEVAAVGSETIVALEVPDLSPSRTVTIHAAQDSQGTFKPVHKSDWSGALSLASSAGNVILPIPIETGRLPILKVIIGGVQSEDKDFWFLANRGES